MAFKMNPGRGNYSKTGRSIPTPFKQVDKEVEAMIAKKKESDAKAKTEKARSEGEAMRKKLEQDIKNKIMAETSKRASADSTAVDKKLRDAGFGKITAGEMGNKKANETRKAGSAYKNIYEKVVLDKSTGKYKRVTGTNTGDVPARQMKKSPAKQMEQASKMPAKKTVTKPKETPNPLKSPMKQLGRQAVTKMGGKKAPAKMKKC